MIVTCPFGCCFSGSIFDIDTHQAYKCKLRLLLRPNDGCDVKMTADKILPHFNECKFYRLICEKCLTPYREDEWDQHDCISALKDYVYGMYNKVFANHINIYYLVHYHFK